MFNFTCRQHVLDGSLLIPEFKFTVNGLRFINSNAQVSQLRRFGQAFSIFNEEEGEEVYFLDCRYWSAALPFTVTFSEGEPQVITKSIHHLFFSDGEYDYPSKKKVTATWRGTKVWFMDCKYW